MSDFLALLRLGRQPPAAPPPPDREADLADDSPFHLAPVHGSARVVGRLAAQLHLGVQPAGDLGGVQGDLELGTLVLFDAKAGGTLRMARDADRHLAHQPVAGGGETAVERAVVVGPLFLDSDLFAVGVKKDDAYLLAGQDLVVVLLLIDADTEPLVLDGLSGSIERAVGKENRPLVGLGPPIVAVQVVAIAAGQRLPLVLGVQQDVSVVAVGRLEIEQAVFVGGGLAPRDPTVSVGVPGADHRLDDRPAAVGVQHKAPHAALPGAGADHQGQIADPEVGEVHLVVAVVEVLADAGDEEVRAGLEVLGGRERFHPRLVILGGRQFVREAEHRLLAQQGSPLFMVQIFWLPAPVQARFPVVGDDAEVDLGDIAIVDSDVGPGGVPDSFGRAADAFGFNLLNQIVTTAAADAVGKAVLALRGDLVRFDQLARALQDRGPAVPGAGRDRMVGVGLGEPLERRLVAGVFFGPKGVVVPEVQPQQIRVQKGRRLVVVLVKPQQVLEQPQGLDLGRGLVGRGDLPGQKLVGRREHGRVGRQVEGVFGTGGGLFARAVEADRLVGQEIVQGRPVLVVDGALDQQVVELGDGDPLQLLFVGQGFFQLPVDFGEQPRQVPGRKIFARRLGRLGPLQEPPAVALEILPVPVGQHGVQQRFHFGRGPGNFGLHEGDLFFRLVALDRPLQSHLAADALDRLGVGLLLDRLIDNRLQPLDGRLGQPLFHGFFDQFPLSVSRSGHGGGGHTEQEKNANSTRFHGKHG